MQKPVAIKYQDASSNEILSALNRLSRELSVVRNNSNQAVYKLHTLDHVQDFKLCAEMTESSRQNFLRKVDEIRQSLNEIRKQYDRRLLPDESLKKGPDFTYYRLK